MTATTNQQQLLLALLPCLSPTASFNTPNPAHSRLRHNIYDPSSHSKAARKRSNPSLLAMLPCFPPASPARCLPKDEFPRARSTCMSCFPPT
ncbi:hypothetical protein HDV64DRAFT_95484 [Trichoderma sp. TUCIM 5745]